MAEIDTSLGAPLREAIPEVISTLLISALEEAADLALTTAGMNSALRADGPGASVKMTEEELEEERGKAMAYRLVAAMLRGDPEPTSSR